MEFPFAEWSERERSIVAQLYPPSSKRDPEPRDAFAELDPELNRLIKTLARGRHYSDPVVDLKTRTLCTISCLAALGASEQLETWVANALRAGATREQVVSIISQLSVYIGVPRLVEAFTAVKNVFDREEEQ